MESTLCKKDEEICNKVSMRLSHSLWRDRTSTLDSLRGACFLVCALLTLAAMSSLFVAFAKTVSAACFDLIRSSYVMRLPAACLWHKGSKYAVRAATVEGECVVVISCLKGGLRKRRLMYVRSVRWYGGKQK